MTAHREVIVIGAGVVGLACAAELAARGRSVIVVERATRAGQGISSRNSGVIHAGIYYPRGSLKAELCIEGRELLYARARARAIGYRELGKLIVAVDSSELAQLEALRDRAHDNGALEAHMLEGREVAALEPNVRAVAALSSPRTGIIDTHALLDSYRAEAIAHGAWLILASEVVAIEPQRDHALRVTTRGLTGERTTVSAEHVVNAAGLGAAEIAALAGVPIEAAGVTQHLCKGDYFKLASRHRALVSRLIYPVPVHAGLGVHLTLDLEGGVRAGPDTEYIAAPRYDIDAGKRASFGAALRRYVPAVRDEDLEPDYAGIRPKLQGPGEAFRDFVIERASAYGAPGLINLLGIESPGLTASGAIARRVAALLAPLLDD
jgi:L-2-hydroxyglutarate oxidase LhgO